jgi:hypothetical protein
VVTGDREMLRAVFGPIDEELIESMRGAGR